MRVLTASDRGLLVETDGLDEAMRLNAALAEVAGIIERVPAARSVLVHFDPRRTSATELTAAIAALNPDAAPPAPTAELTIPVRYDGEDLDEVAALLGIPRDEVVRRHLAATWRVAFAGFAPGFGYLIGDDPLFDLPRRATPRIRVPAGAVGLAGEFTGVYPRESPGGWQLIGRTDAAMWDLHRDPPALLVPGAVVRFVRAEPASVVPVSPGKEIRRGNAENVGSSPSPAESPSLDKSPVPETATIEVTRPALQLLVQDHGRPGYAQLGVSASGIADRTAMRDGNRAVGNAADAAVLECVGAVSLGFTGNGVAAVTGAAGDAVIVDIEGVERPVPMGTPFATFDGDELHLEAPTNGLRYVIAVRGGIRADPVLGSCATDTLAGLGPAPLTLGSILDTGSDSPHLVEPDPAPRTLPAPGELVHLEITLGPRDDWFTPAAVAVLTEQEWLVTPRSDRAGIRLHGDAPLERAKTEELPSEGAVTGAIQVPADGQPVLFLPDHPLTGGYPIIAALTDASLDLAAQLPPGTRIRFRIHAPRD